MKTLNCPQCGNQLELRFRHAKLTVCEHCGSTLFLEDETARLAGKQSTLPQEPSLLQLKIPFQFRHTSYVPVGHSRYSYAHGFWDEWWVLDNAGEGKWLSVDEGDYVIQHPVELKEYPGYADLYLEQQIMLDGFNWWVTELDKARCEGIEGEFPEIIEPGEIYLYAHLSATNNALMTLEYHADGVIKAFRGSWLDPFEIRVDA